MKPCILMGKNADAIHGVFSERIREKMKEIPIDLERVYSDKDIETENFDNVRYIFSTWGMLTLSEKQIKQHFPSLKAVFYAAGTVKYFATPFIKSGVDVFCADSVNAKSVADYVSGQILLATKGYYQAQYEYKQRRMFNKARKISFDHVGNYLAKIGIIGMGRIGRMVIDNLSSFDFDFLVCDPKLDAEEAEKLQCKKVELEEMFETCDVISNHLPDIPSTYHILNYGLFSLMKDNSTFINTGRGRQVAEKELARALKKNRTVTAVLDVTEREPLYPFNRLINLKNVFLTPHIAGSSNQELQRMAEYVIQVYQDVISGGTEYKPISLKDIGEST